MSVSNSTVIKNLFWRYAERFFAQIVTFVVSLVLARLLSPDEYGVVAIVMVIVNMLDVFSTRGFNQALVQKNKVDHVDYSTIFYTNMGINIVLYIIIWFVAPNIANFYKNEMLTVLLRVLSIRFLVNGFNAIQQAYVQRNMQYKKFFYSTSIGTIISAIVGVTVAYLGAGAWALVAQSLTNTCIDTFVLFLTIEWKPRLEYSVIKLKEMSGFGLRMFAMGIIESIYNQLRSLVVGKVYSTVDLAYYNKGQEIPGVVVENIQISSSNVMFSALSRENSLEKVKAKMREYFSVMYYILCPILMGIAVTSRPIVTILYTKKWIHAVPFLIIYCFFYLLWVPQVPILQAINARGYANVSLRVSIIHRVVGIVFLLLVMLRGPIYIAISAVLADVIIVMYIFYQSNKIFGYKFKEMMSDMMGTNIITAIMVLCVWFVGLGISNIILCLGVQVFVGVIIFTVLSFVTKNANFNRIILMIKNRRNRKND